MCLVNSSERVTQIYLDSFITMYSNLFLTKLTKQFNYNPIITIDKNYIRKIIAFCKKHKGKQFVCGYNLNPDS